MNFVAAKVFKSMVVKRKVAVSLEEPKSLK